MSGTTSAELNEIFGSQSSGGEDGNSGQVVFYDSWPADSSGELLQVDVLTPHYGHYYQGGKAPSDDQKPVPIQFLSVPAGIKFEFALATVDIGKRSDKTKLLNRALKFLTDALTTIGIGAKTGSSYGFFKEDEL
jgi:CRISPR-associated protein Cmr6